MKKYIIILLLLLVITGCKKNNINDNNNKDNIKQSETINEEIVSYVDDNPIKIGIYQNNHLVTNVKSQTNRNHEDIGVFSILYTNDEIVDNNSFKYNFNKYYSNYENIDNYKIGFYIKFETDENVIEKTILGPEDKHSMTPYLYNYLYDDIHQADGSWYSHIEPEDMKDNTIFSSIKLYSAQEGSKIKYPITLIAFTYKSDDDFDENGHYRGNSSYTVNIIDK